jgi:hypothetical protein
MWAQRVRLLVAVAGLCLALAGVTGCKKSRATVTGKVTFNGTPITAGTVGFYASANTIGSGPINPDGTYTVPDAPVGEVTVTVTTPKPTMGPQGNQLSKPPPGMSMPHEMVPAGGEKIGTQVVRTMPAPDKYNSPDTSPLKYTVVPGTQTYDIKLTP